VPIMVPINALQRLTGSHGPLYLFAEQRRDEFGL
jgi:hypothetical protein